MFVPEGPEEEVEGQAAAASQEAWGSPGAWLWAWASWERGGKKPLALVVPVLCSQLSSVPEGETTVIPLPSPSSSACSCTD